MNLDNLKKILFLHIFVLCSAAGSAENIALLIADSESALFQKSIQKLNLPDNINCQYFPAGNIPSYSKSHRKYIADADVIVIDVMIREQIDYLKKHINIRNKKVYAVRSA